MTYPVVGGALRQAEPGDDYSIRIQIAEARRKAKYCCGEVEAISDLQWAER